MIAVFPSVAEALTTRRKVARLRVFVAGQLVAVDTADAQFGWDQPIGTASFMIPGPLPSVVDYAATVEIRMGYPGVVKRVFYGRIPARDGAFGRDGTGWQVTARDYGSLLDREWETDLAFPTGWTFSQIFRSLCRKVGHRLYNAQSIRNPSRTVSVMLGGNADIDGGEFIIRRGTNLLSVMADTARLFGARVFGQPSGYTVLRRISGVPTKPTRASYAEGVNAWDFAQSGDTDPMVTFWTVDGAKWADAAGVQQSIRSIPAVVPYRPELAPLGYRAGSVSSDVLVRQELADWVRGYNELDESDPLVLDTWQAEGDPDRRIGDAVEIVHGISGMDGGASLRSAGRWLTGISHRFDAGGYVCDLTAWIGTGEVLAAGEPNVAISLLGSDGRHVGSGTRAGYRRPRADGTRVIIAIPPLDDDYTSLSIAGFAHGFNAFLRPPPPPVDPHLPPVEADPDAAQPPAQTPSAYQVWQQDEDGVWQRIADGVLPVIEDRAGANYALDAPWAAFEVPIGGTLRAGVAAELWLVAGTEGDTGGGAGVIGGVRLTDRGEVRDLDLVLAGAGVPVLPGAPTLFTPAAPRASSV